MRTLTLILCLVANATFAQDRNGNNTPGEWRVDHHKPFGLWDSMCDWRKTGDLIEKRCYLRYVDVFSPRPKFAALFTFITPEPNGHRVEFGFEQGVHYKENGLRVDQNGTTTWALSDQSCIYAGECAFTGDAAAAFLEATTKPSEHPPELINIFTDNHGQQQSLSWDMTHFPEALADFERETDARALR